MFEEYNIAPTVERLSAQRVYNDGAYTMIGCDTAYYNYYNLDRWSPETPQIPTWKKCLIMSQDEIHSVNFNPDSSKVRALVRLEEVYYPLGVENRARFQNVDDLKNHLYMKYLHPDNQFQNYTKSQRQVMYRHELEMSTMGCLSGANFTDPHLTEKVYNDWRGDADFNKKKVGEQVENIMSKAGIDDVDKIEFSLTIDPVTYRVRVFGIDDADKLSRLENALNTGRNGAELFYYILKYYPKKPTDDVFLKYHVMRDYYTMTGADIREYNITAEGFFDKNGNNALDIFKQKLSESKKDYAKEIYGDFMRRLNILRDKGVHSIPDAYLRMGYRDGSLYEIMDEQLYQTAIAYQA